MDFSICIIGKNEERTVRRTLKSIVGLGDEIIFIDTGSKDSTREIVKEYTNKIYDFPWSENFSEAKNFAIEKSTGQWIFFIDCDEELEAEGAKKILDLLENNPSKEGYYLKILNMVNGKEINKESVLRIFKREYRFKGKLHERVTEEIISLKGKKAIGFAEINIKHYGYDKNIKNRVEKNKRNLNILLSYKEIEKDNYYYYALGNEYAISRDFQLAIENYEKAITLIDDLEEIDFSSYLIVNLMKTLINFGKFHTVISTLEKYKNQFSGFRDIYFLAAIAAIKILDYKKAEKYLITYKNIKDEKSIYPSSNFSLNYDIDKLISMASIGAKLQ